MALRVEYVLHLNNKMRILRDFYYYTTHESEKKCQSFFSPSRSSTQSTDIAAALKFFYYIQVFVETIQQDEFWRLFC